jgi:hypothetical protein
MQRNAGKIQGKISIFSIIVWQNPVDIKVVNRKKYPEMGFVVL